MGGRGLSSVALSLAVLAAACSERPSDSPTSPDFAKPGPPPAGCNTTALIDAIKAEFGPSSNETKLANDLKGYGAQTSQATYAGYLLLEAIATKYESPTNQAGSRVNASNAAIEIIRCQNVGASVPPTSFVVNLGSTGAFDVVNLTENDNHSVTSHDNVWVFEPPAGQTWQAITTLATEGLDDSVKSVFLAFGARNTNPGFSDDDQVGTVFDWTTTPEATFSGSGAVVGECPSPSNFLQHNFKNVGPEVLGFVPPSCYVVVTAMEREPRTFVERIWRMISPTPAFASLLTSTGTGGSKNRLSPFGLIDPDLVNLEPVGFTWKKSGYIAGVPFADNIGSAPKYQIESQAGTVFLQDFVLIYLEGETNNGVKKRICNNYAFTNAKGVAQFPAAFSNEAGGFIVFAKTTGTTSKPDVQQGAAPVVPPGASVPSPGINVKNGTVTGECLTFSGGPVLPQPPGPNGFAP
jgi:hypothetical protein